MKRLFLTSATVLLMVGLAGCGQSSTPAASPAASSGSAAAPAATPVAVVASTNVYGSIAAAVGGDQVAVTSIIDEPDKDPHEYEADAQNQLALSKAQVVIENGGGYDDFVDTMLKASSAKATVINVANLSGYNQKPAEGEFNEHMWYDFPTVAKLVTQLTTDLSAANPAGAETFKANAAAFTTKLTALETSQADIKKAHAGDGVAITEPVPLYLLNAAGLKNLTPDEFSEAIEEDTDVPPAVLKETVGLFEKKSVKLLAYNEQTTGPQTETVLAAAKKNDVAVVPVTETLPEGKDYLTWMQDNISAVSQALGS